MANQYCNLVGTDKIKDSYTQINAGFDLVEADMNAVEATANASLPKTGGTVTGKIILESAGTSANSYSREIQFNFVDSSGTKITNRLLSVDPAGKLIYSISGVASYTVWNASNAGPFFVGFGAPEGSIAAPVGSIFQRADGGTSTTLYVKESGSGNTGWKAVQTA